MQEMARILIGLTTVVGLIGSAQPANALPIPTPNVIQVNTLVYSDNGSDGMCSLREALQSAFNADGNPYHECAKAVMDQPSLVTFSVPGVISIPEQLPYIHNQVYLLGPVVLDGANLPSPVINIVSTGILTLTNLTLKNAGYSYIRNQGGALYVAGASFEGNASGGGGGAAILNESGGSAYIAGTSFFNNHAAPGTSGGAIYSTGGTTLKVAGAAFTGNSADTTGGAIAFSGEVLDIGDSAFTGNSVNGGAFKGGGAVDISANGNQQPITITRSAFTGNASTDGWGGAIFAHGPNTVTIKDSSFQANVVAGVNVSGTGGAIGNTSPLVVQRSTFFANAVTGNGGAIYNQGSGQVTLGSVSFSANTATGKGGAFANLNSTDGTAMQAFNVTMAGNIAQKGGGIYNEESSSDVITITNSILSLNLPFDCADNDVTALPIRSGGHNLVDDLSCVTLGSSDLGVPALLEVPGIHGGPISTLMVQRPSVASPAIDAGDDAICANVWVEKKDVRGKDRPVDENNDGIKQCDIGAVEADQLKVKLQASPAPNSTLDFGNGAVGNAIAPLSLLGVSNGGDLGTLLKLTNPAISGPNAADFSVAVLPTNLPAGGFTTYANLTCTPNAVGTRTATLTFSTSDSDNASVSYNLICEGVAQPTAGFASLPAAPGPLSMKTKLGTPKFVALVLNETGNSALTLGAPQITSNLPSAFAIQGVFPLSIADGGAAQAILVKCDASAVGLATGTLSFTTNDPANPNVSYNLACDVEKTPDPILDSASLSALADGQAPNVGHGPYGIAMSPDGKHVYVADDGNNKLTLYTRNADNTLTYQTQYGVGATPGLTGTVQVMVSADGRNVYVSGYIGHAIAAYKRDGATGLLTLIATAHEGSCVGLFCSSTVTGMSGAYGMAMSPDGKYTYVSGINSNSVDVFSRLTISGSLYGSLNLFGPMFVQQYTDTQLSGAYGIAISPDGANLYATGYASGSLLVLKRNPGTGKLSTTQVLTSAAASGLAEVFRVIVSADGKFVYTAAFDTNAVCAFVRSQADGSLTFITCYINGNDGIADLDAASDVALSPDGKHLFATAYNSGSVVVFERDPASGTLRYAQSITSTMLAGARGIVVSPEGDALYVTGHSNNQVVMIPFAHPKPSIDSLLPASAIASNNPFFLTVHGDGFYPGSVIRWGGVDHLTEYVNAHELRATIGGNEQEVSPVQVRVFNPSPGGGLSSFINFTLFALPPPPTPGNPPPPQPVLIPALAHISPAGAPVGSGSMQVTLEGADIATNASVLWNGVARSLIRDTDKLAHFTLAPSDLNSAGINTVQVFNPVSGALVDMNAPAVQGNSSNTLQFVVSPVSENPIPAIDSLSPAAAIAGSTQGVEVLISGSNFMASTQVRWNGQDKPGQYVSKTQIKATLTAEDLALSGNTSVSVLNPAPGGGESNIERFAITPAFVASSLTALSLAVGISDAGTLVTVNGSGFADGDVLLINEVPYPATFVNASKLQALLNGSGGPTFAQSFTVSVQRPSSAGGGDSAELLWQPRHVLLPLAVR